MDRTSDVLARAVSDGEDRLLNAEEPLAGLQIRCGGELPGKIAVPELRELVAKARRYGFRLARAVAAQDGAQAVSAWIEVVPFETGEGCEIRLLNWQSAPLAPEDADALVRTRQETDRQLAELTARLDAAQRLLAVECDGGELAELAAAMEAGLGQVWTEFVEVTPSAAEATNGQPLHWRLLDGMTVSVANSTRSWRVVLVPQMPPGFEPVGFELLLLSDEPPPELPVAEQGAEPARQSLVGGNLAPVLRQPIARIIANAETIRTRLAGPLAEEYVSYASDIASAGKLLMGLLEDLSDLEVLESEGFSTAADAIDLGDVARQAAGILNVRAQEKRISIDAPQPAESLPATAEFRRVLQILLNLIGNAIHYSPEDSHIWVRLEGEGARARVIVADQGPGLTDDEQARVFEKFERLGRSGDGGSGLGLYISRSLARKMGGELSVESAPGQGARFILEVPADTGSD